MIPDLVEHRQTAFATPCLDQGDVLNPRHAFLFVERGRRWSAILTVNR